MEPRGGLWPGSAITRTYFWPCSHHLWPAFATIEYNREGVGDGGGANKLLWASRLPDFVFCVFVFFVFSPPIFSSSTAVLSCLSSQASGSMHHNCRGRISPRRHAPAPTRAQDILEEIEIKSWPGRQGPRPASHLAATCDPRHSASLLSSARTA